MSRDLERWYRETLASLNLAEVARETDRGHRTLHAYMRGERNVTKEAVEQLIKYLRVKSDTFTAAADKMAAALEEEG
jgi:RNase H-fold protein (predicted Holliday junction resolvase)